MPQGIPEADDSIPWRTPEVFCSYIVGQVKFRKFIIFNAEYLQLRDKDQLHSNAGFVVYGQHVWNIKVENYINNDHIFCWCMLHVTAIIKMVANKSPSTSH